MSKEETYQANQDPQLEARWAEDIEDLKKWQMAIEKLKPKAGAEARMVAYHQQLADLAARQEALQRKLQALQQLANETWEEFKIYAESGMALLQQKPDRIKEAVSQTRASGARLEPKGHRVEASVSWAEGMIKR